MSAYDAVPILLLYDGRCGFCDGVVQFVLAHDRRGAMQFAPLHGPHARAVLARHASLRGIDSLVLVYADKAAGGERVAVRSAAAIAVAEYVGGVWRLASVLRLVPRAWRDWGYDQFARRRYGWFGERDHCRIPDARSAARFLD